MRSLLALILLAVGLDALAAPGLLSEGFDNIATLPGSGWIQTNNSSPIGTTQWFQGNSGIFPSQAGAPDAYIAANFDNAGAAGNISNWLITPTVTLANGEVFSFYTRTEVGIPFPDRLEVRLSTNGATFADVGGTATSVGDFTTLLLAINPNLEVGGYPEDWTQFSITLSGLGAGVSSGRFAFRYFVTNTNLNADYIGIDTVLFSAVPEPSKLVLCALALSILGFARRRRQHA
jgi:hypothetical protein